MANQITDSGSSESSTAADGDAKEDLLDAAAVKFVKNFKDKSTIYTRPYFEKFSKLFDEYVAPRNSRRAPLQRANLKFPYGFTVIETYVPYIIDAFLGDKPYLNLEAKKQMFQVFERGLENFLSNQLDEMKFIEAFTLTLKNFFIYGTSIATAPWLYEEKKVFKRDPVLGRVPDTQIVDRPDYQPISIFDFFPDWRNPAPGNIQKMRGCIHRVWKSYNDIKALEEKTLEDGTVVGLYRNVDQLKNLEMDQESDTRRGGGATDQYLSAHDRSLGLEENIKRKDMIELWVYWGLWDYDGSGEEQECRVTIANGSVCLARRPNPFDRQFKPFVACVDYPVEGEFYGLGELEPVWSLIKEAGALRNARLDAANQAVNRMWLVDRTGNINTKNLYSRAGGIILTDDMNSIKPLDPPEVVGSAFREVSELDYGIQQAVALPNPAAGAAKVGAGYGQTATGVNYLQNLTTSRATLKVKLLSAQLFDQLIQILLWHNMQFLTDQAWVRDSDDPNPFKQIPPEAFSGEYAFIPHSALDRMSRQSRQMALEQHVVPLLKLASEMSPGQIAFDRFIPAALRDLNYRGAEQFINPPQVVQQIQQGRVQAEMQKADANAQSQANAQAQLVHMKNVGNMETQQVKNEGALQQTVAKTVLESAKARDEQETANNLLNGGFDGG